MSTFKLEKRYFIRNSDLPEIGVGMGYEWNQVCNEIAKNQAYGMDGSGSFNVERDEYDYGEVLNSIFDKIFADNPEVTDFDVID